MNGNVIGTPQMMKRLKDNDKIVSRYMDDEKFQKVIFSILAKDIYGTISTQYETTDTR